MSRQRARLGIRALDPGHKKIVWDLPNELFMEVWDYLPPMERVSVSQVCSKWRLVALSTRRLWSRVLFFSSRHSSRCSCGSCRGLGPESRGGTVYHPPSNTSNAAFFEQLLLRSARLRLDVTLLLVGSRSRCDENQKICFDLLVPHSARLSRVHCETGSGATLGELARLCGSLPALRTFTAGFDDRRIEYFNLRRRRFPGTPFPVLNQVHIGAAFDHFSGIFRGTAMPSVRALTLTPVYVHITGSDVSMCPNLSRLSLVMARFPPPETPNTTARDLRELAKLVAHVREVCLLDIPVALEGYILESFNSARHRHLILDYLGRPCVAGSSWGPVFPGPCDALADAVRLTLRLRESVFEIDVSDARRRRREVLLDQRTIRMAPGLWDCYVRGKTIASATVDALAWDYFTAGMPEACEIPDLTLVVARTPSELTDVSLARISSLRKLRVDSLRSGLRLDAPILRRLVESRAEQGENLAVLSLSSGVQVENTAVVAQLASTVIYE